jgi:hypothetical protein
VNRAAPPEPGLRRAQLQHRRGGPRPTAFPRSTSYLAGVAVAMRLQGVGVGRLARIAGMGRTALWGWLAGKTEPTLEDSNALRHILGLPPSHPIPEEPKERRSW